MLLKREKDVNASMKNLVSMKLLHRKNALAPATTCDRLAPFAAPL